MQPLALWVIGLVLVFDFLMGAHGAGTVVSTVISSRAFSPRRALATGAAAEFAGAFLLGTAVARTVGSQIVRPADITLQMLLAALMGAIGWQALTWFLGIPSSSSHGLVGGMAGAALTGSGLGALQAAGLLKVLLALFVSPLLGFGLGFVLLRLVYRVAAGASPRINESFKSWQLLTVTFLAVSSGSNDAQKAMGVIVLALILDGKLQGFAMPLWVVAVSAGVMALGTALGGWGLIRTVGGKFFRVRPVHSFAAQLASSLILLAASLFGLPVASSHVGSSATIGVGSAERVSKVRWEVASSIVWAWVLTLPATGLLAAGIYWLLSLLIA
jgi:PiT family inorganic phosphate transporter